MKSLGLRSVETRFLSLDSGTLLTQLACLVEYSEGQRKDVGVLSHQRASGRRNDGTEDVGGRQGSRHCKTTPATDGLLVVLWRPSSGLCAPRAPPKTLGNTLGLKILTLPFWLWAPDIVRTPWR